jgi:hypothetical protein
LKPRLELGTQTRDALRPACRTSSVYVHAKWISIEKTVFHAVYEKNIQYLTEKKNAQQATGNVAETLFNRFFYCYKIILLRTFLKLKNPMKISLLITKLSISQT